MRDGSYITLFSPSDITAFYRMKYGGGGVLYNTCFHRVTSLRFTAGYSLCDPGLGPGAGTVVQFIILLNINCLY